MRHMPAGRIVRIERGAVHDGPGLRTVVFFKGCPLRCAWCHSPETQSFDRELVIRQDRCIRCGSCLAACPEHAAVERDAGTGVDRERCIVCGDCADACPTGARELVGREVSVADVMEEIERDRIFYDESGGGVTFSGGEPFLQPQFLEALLDACRAAGIHTAVETCGLANPAALMRAAERTDLFLFDLKLMDDLRHKQATGMSNRRILANLRALAAAHANIVIRLPLIPTINDDCAHIKALGALAASLGLKRVDVLPYHRAGLAKYARLDREYRLEGLTEPDMREVATVVATLRSFGLDARGSGRLETEAVRTPDGADLMSRKGT